MRKQLIFTLLLVITLFGAVAVHSQVTAFTYQGKLTDGATPANGQYDFVFRLFDAATGGNQVSIVTGANDAQVTGGIFTVTIDFGLMPFIASNPGLFLDMAIRPGASNGPYDLLSPRQPLTSSPYSIRSLSASSADTASNVSGIVPINHGGTGSFTQSFIDLTANQVINGRKEFSNLAGDGSLLTNVDGASIKPASVGSNQLGNTSVDTANLKDKAVTNPKIADAAVDTRKIADGSITKSKLATDYQNGFDPQLVALNRWDLIAVPKNNITVSRRPSALAFDGTFMYVANKLDNTVTRIRTSTGVVEGSPITVGTAPAALAYDGTFMYVANSGSNSVSRIRAGTGAVEGSPISVGTAPMYLTFDGTFMNVGNTGNNTVTRIRASSGAIDGDPIATQYSPTAQIFDGTYVYVVSNSVGGGQALQKITVSTGAIATVPNIAARSLSFDGTFIYAGGQNSIARIRASTGVIEPVSIATVTNTALPILCIDGIHLYGATASSILGSTRTARDPIPPP